jgi:hypothetical protein
LASYEELSKGDNYSHKSRILKIVSVSFCFSVGLTIVGVAVRERLFLGGCFLFQRGQAFFRGSFLLPARRDIAHNSRDPCCLTSVIANKHDGKFQ